MCGWFAGTFFGTYICLDPPLFVDSSSMLMLLTLLGTLALAGAERQLLLTKCVARSLDFASDVRSPAELTMHLPNLCTCNTTSSREGGGDCKVKAFGYRLCVLLGNCVYMLPDILGVHYDTIGYSCASVRAGDCFPQH